MISSKINANNVFPRNPNNLSILLFIVINLLLMDKKIWIILSINFVQIYKAVIYIPD
jgi:hypothetical protein